MSKAQCKAEMETANAILQCVKDRGHKGAHKTSYKLLYVWKMPKRERFK